MRNVYLRVTLWSLDTAIRPGKGTTPFHDLSPEARYAALAEMVEKAYRRDESNRLWDEYEGDRPVVASLFVAPEYFFAASSTLHAMSETKKNEVIGALKALSGQYEKLILVPGTIAWRKRLLRTDDEWYRRDRKTRQRTSVLKTESREERFYRRVNENLSKQHLMVDQYVEKHHGLDNPWVDLRRHQRVTEIEDERIRTVNQMWVGARTPENCFIARNTLYAFHGGNEIARYQKRINYEEVFDYESQNERVIFEPGGGPDGHGDRFELDDVTFGIEICADHQGGYLRHSGVVPDVHILVSASVFVVPRYVTVREGSFLVHASSDPDVTGVWNHQGERITLETPQSVTHGELHRAELQFRVD